MTVNFTEEQLEAISAAMADYADYGTEEATVADQIQEVIAAAFNA